jgi:hypothetical protein
MLSLENTIALIPQKIVIYSHKISPQKFDYSKMNRIIIKKISQSDNLGILKKKNGLWPLAKTLLFNVKLPGAIGQITL